MDLVLAFQDWAKTLENMPEGPLRVPQIRFVDGLSEFFLRAEGLEGNPVLACEWFVVLVCGEHDLVATEPQFERQAQHGENITGTAKRRANELHGVTLNSFRSRTCPSRFLISTAIFNGFLVKVSKT